MIQRQAAETLRYLAAQFRVVAVVGPRQSGKTTLVRLIFPDKSYVNFENPDIRNFAIEDPRGFLSNYANGAIFDEVQRVPLLFSYLQQIVDEQNTNGMFVLTGSNNFLLQESIGQSLAGRVGYLQLLPLSITEIGSSDLSVEDHLYKGGYPALYDKGKDVKLWMDNYIRTYIERDVRQLKNITDLITFERFIRLCAGRTGQLLNKSSLSIECGIDNKTVEAWLSVLEASFVIFRLQPYHNNYNKRIVKMPKLYFYDTGLATNLLGIQKAEQLILHPFRGALFENMVIVELLKQRWNKATPDHLYFWRDNAGHEMDVIMENAGDVKPLEIKSGKTITNEYLKGLLYWHQLTGRTGGLIIYAGDMIQKRSQNIEIRPYYSLSDV
ncbi:MAG: ATP-binding protein [Saprospiraceae bacterium]